jgi:Ca-activated chloride channel family protein
MRARRPAVVLAVLVVFDVLCVLVPRPLAGAATPTSPTPAPPSRAEQRELTAKLPEKYRQWLLEVDPILSEEERAAFFALAKDYQRDAFIERFWQSHNSGHTGRNEFRLHWEEKVEEAKARFKGDLTDERARVLLLNGPPADTLVSDCPLLLVPLEVWYYEQSDAVNEQLIVILYRKWGSAPFRVWHPGDGTEVFFAEGVGASRAGAQTIGSGDGKESGRSASATPAQSLGAIVDPMNGCGDPDKAMKIVGAIQWVIGQGMHWDILQAKFDGLPPKRAGEWVATFNSYSTDVPADAPALPARLDVGFPGRRQNRTVVQGVVTVAAADAVEARLGEHRSYDFQLTGEVLREGALFDSFRYKFDLPPLPPGNAGSFPLVFQRWLRPGEYTLVVKVEDVTSGKLFRIEQSLTVPARTGPDTTAVPSSPTEIESARLLAEAADDVTGGPLIRIVRPHGEMQTGMQRFDAMVSGSSDGAAGITGVTFTLDGKPVLTKKKPPFSVELDLGPVPHTRTLVATAFDAGGSELARDELMINAAGHHFRVHLTEPQRGRRYSGTLLARAGVEPPEGESVERVEIWLNETRIATLFQPPWAQPVALPPGQAVAYVRAVAYLADGSSAEDLVFVNAPENLEEMNVDLVELYASVLDRDGHPVSGLTARDFSVREDGKPQEILRFDRVTSLPIHAAVALDVSASMDKSLGQAREAALRFLQRTIHAKDWAAVIPFNDHPTLAVKFTHDLDALAGGLAGLKAERGTALYDTVVFTLYYFNGIKGQRAMLLLSDGKDEGSRFTWEQTLEFARRAGVTLYTIGLGAEVEKKKMKTLAEETGGRAFFLDDASRLDDIYARIEEELRSQYLIAYQSTQSSQKGGKGFRAVDLVVGKKGLEVKTIRGYYP